MAQGMRPLWRLLGDFVNSMGEPCIGTEQQRGLLVNDCRSNPEGVFPPVDVIETPGVEVMARLKLDVKFVDDAQVDGGAHRIADSLVFRVCSVLLQDDVTVHVTQLVVHTKKDIHIAQELSLIHI